MTNQPHDPVELVVEVHHVQGDVLHVGHAAGVGGVGRGTTAVVAGSRRSRLLTRDSFQIPPGRRDLPDVPA